MLGLSVISRRLSVEGVGGFKRLYCHKRVTESRRLKTENP